MWKWRTGESLAGVLAIDPVGIQALLRATGPVDVDGQAVSADTVLNEVFLNQYLSLTDEDTAQAARRERLGAIARATVEALDTGSWDTVTLLDALRSAGAGRHVLAWSGDETQARGWDGMGIDGELSEDSVLLAMLNRGGNKLDQFLSVSARLEIEPGGSHTAPTSVTIRATVSNNTPPTCLDTLPDRSPVATTRAAPTSGSSRSTSPERPSGSRSTRVRRSSRPAPTGRRGWSRPTSRCPRAHSGSLWYISPCRRGSVPCRSNRLLGSPASSGATQRGAGPTAMYTR